MGKPAEVLRSHYDTFASDGLEAAARLWDPQIEWHAMDGAHHGVVSGMDAMRRYYAEWVDAMADLRAEVAEIVYEDDERVAALILNSGRGRVSGVPAAGSYYVACLVRNGRIVVGREYTGRDDAIAGARDLA